MLALINAGAVIQQVAEGSQVLLPDGRTVCPAHHGWFSVAPTEPAAEGAPQPADVADGYELRTIGDADPVPAGKRIVSTSVEIISGEPKYVYELADLTVEELWSPVRAERDVRLAACDWTQLADCPLAVEAKAAWATYRQALRDLPESESDPESIVWPTTPA